MRILLAFAFSLGLAASAQAQASDETMAAAERFVQNPVQQAMLDNMLSVDALIGQFRGMFPQASEEELQTVAEITAEEMADARPLLEQAMVESAAEHFSVEEIEALNAFYSTELGASVMSKMDVYMATAWQIMGPGLQEMQVRVDRRVRELLQ